MVLLFPTILDLATVKKIIWLLTINLMTVLNSVICSIKRNIQTNYNDVNENILQHFMYDDREHYAQIAYNDENAGMLKFIIIRDESKILIIM